MIFVKFCCFILIRKTEIMTRTDRILAVMRDKADGKQKDFAKAIGIGDSTFSESRTKGSWSIKAIDGILNRYPDISAEWLIRGEGDMYKPKKKSNLLNCCVTEEEADDVIDDMLPTTTYDEVEEVKPQDGVPYIHDAFGCGIEEYARQNMNDVEYIRVPAMPKTKFFCDAKGDSMAPLISNGDIVGMYEIPLSSYIPLGEIYGIETDELTTIKRLRKGSTPDKFLLEPINKEYEADEIDKADIRHIFKVTGCIKSF